MKVIMKVKNTIAMIALAISASYVHSATFTIEKQNTSFSIDGNGGAIEGQQLYLWNTNTNNVNQQWVQVNHGDGYYNRISQSCTFIFMTLQNVCFRTPERFMIKARILLMVVPLITYVTTSMICSGVPKGEYLIKSKGLYAALLVSIREQPFSSINALPLSLLILAETSISR